MGAAPANNSCRSQKKKNNNNNNNAPLKRPTTTSLQRLLRQLRLKLTLAHRGDVSRQLHS
jgi:hypothetical protein